MKTSRLLVCVIVGIAFHLVPISRADDIFTFAGFTFDQRNTPNQATRLGNNANLGGAMFSAGFATETTLNPITFPQGGPGFNTNISLAQLSGLKAGLYAVNLPDGNQGSTARHGLEVSWSNGRAMENSPGKDFVVYESASSIEAVEGVMARVRTNWSADLWTDWFYFPPTNFQITMGVNGCHSYGFDVSNMGVAEGASFDRIQIANLMQADRISGTYTNVGGTLVGEGRVVFDGSTLVFPDAGIYDSDRFFVSDQFDPDPLYLASLGASCEVIAPQLTISRAGPQVNLIWPAPSCFMLQSAVNLTASNTLWSPVNNPVFLTNGFNLVTIHGTNDGRFFRLAK